MTPEEGQYYASLVTSERGQLYSLKTMYYGKEEDGIKPNTTFVREMDANPELWENALKIENLINGMGKPDRIAHVKRGERLASGVELFLLTGKS